MADNINIQFNNQPDNYWPCRGRSFLLEMLMLLQSLFRIESTNALELEKVGKHNEIIREMHLRYSEADYNPKKSRNLSGLRGFAELIDFKRNTGKTCFEYLEGIRITVAENLLKNTLLEISEISRRCGFISEKEFSKFFISLKKITPLNWRAKFPNPYG
ncbi:MAG: helix-turn-helix domain-containing protein [Spirochaetales bacterium]|nr:helix-turn-helix domain-containing protein [Spirochaetales bacterium]